MKALCLAILLGMLVCTPAFADSVSYDINISNGAITPPAASYGTINLSLNNDGTITVSVNMASGYLIGAGNGASALAFNFGSGVNDTLVSLSSTLPSGFNYSCCSTGQVNGFGSFLAEISGSNSSSSVANLVFTLSTSQVFSGQTSAGFTSVFQLVGLSSGGAGDGNQDFAVHVVPTAANGKTGYAGTTTQIPVPDTGQGTLLLGTLICAGGIWFSRSHS